LELETDHHSTYNRKAKRSIKELFVDIDIEV